MIMAKWKIAGINFDHFHMGDNLRMAHEHPEVEIVGLCDEQPERMQEAAAHFSVPADRLYTDHEACLTATEPDLVLLCPATARHAEWTEKVAPFDAHILIHVIYIDTLSNNFPDFVQVHTNNSKYIILFHAHHQIQGEPHNYQQVELR